ncbi:MAG: hypothetical protein IPK19_21660 [Chloroflexi bacterium]|nr:hypothetical protein [Chloroflexota bacterium]
MDYHLIYGPTFERVLEQYCWLTGRPALLPDCALGYLGSTMTYTEAEDAQAQLAKFARLCQEHDIPLRSVPHVVGLYHGREWQALCVQLGI